MDNDRRRCVAKGASCNSGIQGGDHEMFFNRIISRNSSVGCSSRIYYYRSSEGIPFDWEMQPGKPKAPQKEDILPPISPPPAMLSLGLPKPCINIEEPKPPLIIKLIRFKFWKQGKNNNKKLRHDHQADHKGGSKLGDDILNVIDHEYSNYEMFSSSDDGEFMASPRMSGSSSSSSLSFSNGGLSFRSSRLPSPSGESSWVDRHYGCSPLNFSSVLVRVSRSRRP